MRVPKRRGEEFARQKKTHDPHVSVSKIKRMEKELEDLTKNQRPAGILEMQRTAEDGDFSENTAYQDAKWRLRRINSRITYLEETLKTAVPIPSGTDKEGRVRIGSIVRVHFNGTTKSFQLLGSQETNPFKGTISHLSPLGKLLMNRKAGEMVTLETNGNAMEYEILEIE